MSVFEKRNNRIYCFNCGIMCWNNYVCGLYCCFKWRWCGWNWYILWIIWDLFNLLWYCGFLIVRGGISMKYVFFFMKWIGCYIKLYWVMFYLVILFIILIVVFNVVLFYLIGLLMIEISCNIVVGEFINFDYVI